MKNLFTRNSIAIFIFIFAVLFIAQAQAARYNSTSSGSNSSAYKPYSAPAPQKSVSFGSSNNSTSTVIRQNSGTNAATNIYKKDLAATPPVSPPLKTPTAYPAAQTQMQMQTKQPTQMQQQTANTVQMQQQTQQTPQQQTKVVVIKEKTVVERQAPVYDYRTLDLIHAMSAAERAAYYSRRDSEEYREWRRRAEIEALQNENMRLKLAQFDKEASEYSSQTAAQPATPVPHIPTAVLKTSNTPAPVPAPKRDFSMWWFSFAILVGVGAGSCGYLIYRANKK